jgi:ABC-2 type transport system ATP-binding protein
MIHIKQLSKAYGSHLVLDDINLMINPGQVTGIVGKNGAGKTTLFKCLSHLESYAGSIESPYQPLKDHLGFLPTIPYFFKLMTGAEYIRLLCNAKKVDVPDLKKINIFSLPLDEYAVHYSTGMKKKLALTALLQLKNQVYILDEPFNGVDIQSNLIIDEIISRLKGRGHTILISSHIFSTLEKSCDVIHLLTEGKITKSVGPDQFSLLHEEMKDASIDSLVNRLEF